MSPTVRVGPQHVPPGQVGIPSATVHGPISSEPEHPGKAEALTIRYDTSKRTCPQPTSKIRTTSTRSSTASGPARPTPTCPEYIRLIAQGRYTDAYMLNRESNVFPGHPRAHLRPAVRAGVPPRRASTRSRSRSAGSSASPPTCATTSPTACRRRPRRRTASASPASAPARRRSPSPTISMPLGYEVTIFEKLAEPGGLMRTNIPAFRLPREGARRGDRHDPRHGRRRPLRHAASQSMKALLDRGRTTRSSSAPARRAARTSTSPAATRQRPTSTSASTGSSRSPSATSTRSASACSSSASATPRWTAAARRARLGGKDSRSWRAGRASTSRRRRGSSRTPRRSRSRSSSTTRPSASWSSKGKLDGMEFERSSRARTPRASSCRRPLDTVVIPADDVILAIGQENAFPWIERDIGIEFDKWDMPGRRQDDLPVDAPRRLLRRRRGVGPEEHHLGRRARRTRRRSRSTTTARASPSPSGRRTGMNLVDARRWGCTSGATATTTTRPKRAEDEARRARRALQEAQHRGRARASPPSRRRARSSAASTATSRRSSPTSSASSATPASTSARCSCLTIAPRRRGARAAHAPQRAGDEPEAGPLRLGPAAADRAGHGQGRGRLRALRPLRRALPDGGVGHGEVRARHPLRGTERRAASEQQ